MICEVLENNLMDLAEFLVFPHDCEYLYGISGFSKELSVKNVRVKISTWICV